MGKTLSPQRREEREGKRVARSIRTEKKRRKDLDKKKWSLTKGCS
jgi:hypothetical protein